MKRLSLSADLCIHSYWLSRLREASHRKMIQSSALRLRLYAISKSLQILQPLGIRSWLRLRSQCSEPKLKKKEDVFLSLAFGFNVPEKMYFQCIKIWPAISRFFSNLIEHKNTWLLSISCLSYGNLLRVHIRFKTLMGIQTTMIFLC